MNCLPLLLVLAALASPDLGRAAPRTDSAVLAMVLEPAPGLDPTTASAASIGEIVHLNVLEGLTKIRMDGSVVPLLAERWQVAPDGLRYTFTLRRGVRFHDGEAFAAADVKFSFERAKAAGSTNKAKAAVFDNIARIETPDASTVVLVLARPDANLLFRLGENTAVILDPKSAATTATKPVGTGPYRFASWSRGSSVTLVKNADWRDAASVALNKVVFRFIEDPAAQVAALLAGDVDAMPRFGAVQSLAQFRNDPRFSVVAGGTAGKTIVAINNHRQPLDDVRVRRAVAAAIDRRAVIDGSAEGLAKPIGSHAVTSDAGYVDLTGANPYDPAKARALLKEAGVALPLKLTLALPPPAYARKGGEIVAAQLAAVGIEARIEAIEWAQWMAGPFKGRFDLTLISHVEPLDIDRYADPGYYWGYDSKAFAALFARYNASTGTAARLALFGDMQRLIASDSVNVFLYELPQFAVANRRLTGVWSSSPVFANDLAALKWQ